MRAATGWRHRVRRLPVAPYLFIAPNLLLFSTFTFLPLLFAVYISFNEWGLLGQPHFIAAGNYARIVEDRLFWRALGNTVVYSLGTVPTSLALGLALALALDRPLPGRSLIRSTFFLPVVISGVATAVIAAWLFNDNYGVINAVLQRIGLPKVNWLSSPSWALPSLVITTLWVRLGFCMVVYLAALQSIPSDYYHAAAIDGASRWAQFRYIVWPLLSPATFLLLILNVIYSFQVFDLIYVMTGGGPGFATTMLVQYIYQSAFITSEMGYASAIGVVLYLLILGFTVLQWRISRQAQNAL
ncbi:MAG: sugar ABC transporter permease [Proteobacteria bacterium]|nr:sugar ABC transporter permease [Pseudomonadota bacterium]MBI3498415.1 sugar ABC transporter permease [Pseudomonadota bacterium]